MQSYYQNTPPQQQYYNNCWQSPTYPNTHQTPVNQDSLQQGYLTNLFPPEHFASFGSSFSNTESEKAQSNIILDSNKSTSDIEGKSGASFILNEECYIYKLHEICREMFINEYDLKKSCERVQEFTWERTDYTGFSTIHRESVYQQNENLLLLSPSSHVNVTHQDLLQDFVTLLKDAHVPSKQITSFLKVCGSIGLLFQAYALKGSPYSHRFQRLLSPTIITGPVLLDLENPEEIEKDFVRHLLRRLHDANFTPLSEDEFKFCNDFEKSILFENSLRLCLEKLDKDLLSQVIMPQTKASSPQQPPSFSQHCLIFYRGLHMRPPPELPFLQELEMVLRRIFRKPGKTNRNTKSTRDEQKVFWPKKGHKEPHFEEVIVAYRSKNPGDKTNFRDANQRMINLQRYHNLPARYLLSALPTSQGGWNWADAVWIMLLASLLISAFMKVGGGTSFFFTLFSLGISLVVLPFIRRWIFAQRSHTRALSDQQKILRQNSVQWSGKGVLEYLERTSWSEETMGTMIVYFIIWTHQIINNTETGMKGISFSELSQFAQTFFEERYNQYLKINLLSSIRKLSEANVLVQEGSERYHVLPPSEALRSIDSLILSQTHQAYLKFDS